MVENQCYYLEYYRLKEVWCARGITIICCQTTRSFHFQVHQVSVPEFYLYIISLKKKNCNDYVWLGKFYQVFDFQVKYMQGVLSVHSRTICTSVLHSIHIVLSVVFGLTSFSNPFGKNRFKYKIFENMHYCAKCFNLKDCERQL